MKYVHRGVEAWGWFWLALALHAFQKLAKSRAAFNSPIKL